MSDDASQPGYDHIPRFSLLPVLLFYGASPDSSTVVQSVCCFDNEGDDAYAREQFLPFFDFCGPPGVRQFPSTVGDVRADLVEHKVKVLLLCQEGIFHEVVQERDAEEDRQVELIRDVNFRQDNPGNGFDVIEVAFSVIAKLVFVSILCDSIGYLNSRDESFLGDLRSNGRKEYLPSGKSLVAHGILHC